MLNCKHKQGGFCVHYQQANPPEAVCANCGFYVKKEQACRHIYDGNWCLRIVNREHWWRKRREGKCETCDWV